MSEKPKLMTPMQLKIRALERKVAQLQVNVDILIRVVVHKHQVPKCLPEMSDEPPF